MWFGDIDLQLRYPTTLPNGGIAPGRMKTAQRRYLARRIQRMEEEQRALRKARIDSIVAWLRRLVRPKVCLKQWPAWKATGPRWLPH